MLIYLYGEHYLYSFSSFYLPVNIEDGRPTKADLPDLLVQGKDIYIYIYIYIERERERGVTVCVYIYPAIVLYSY